MMLTEFHKSYLKDFNRKTSRVKDAGQSFSDLETSLSLVGEDDLEESLRFKELATKLRRFCDEELVALDQRVGVLLGDANLQANDNPFSPQVICDGYKQACRQVTTNARVFGSRGSSFGRASAATPMTSGSTPIPMASAPSAQVA